MEAKPTAKALKLTEGMPGRVLRLEMPRRSSKEANAQADRARMAHLAEVVKQGRLDQELEKAVEARRGNWRHGPNGPIPAPKTLWEKALDAEKAMQEQSLEEGESGPEIIADSQKKQRTPCADTLKCPPPQKNIPFRSGSLRGTGSCHPDSIAKTSLEAMRHTLSHRAKPQEHPTPKDSERH